MYYRCCGETWYCSDSAHCFRCGQLATVIADENGPTPEGIRALQAITRDAAIRDEQGRAHERDRPRKNRGKRVDPKCSRCGRPRILRGHYRTRGMLAASVPQDFPR